MKDNYSIDLKCFFCDSPLTGPEDKEYRSGDMIKCTECGELNDFDSLMDVAKEEAIGVVKSDAQKELNKTIKKLFK
jgi:hypothetical protein